MLLKITELTLRYIGSWDEPAAGVTVEHSVETWINPERVARVQVNPRYYEGYAQILTANQVVTVSLEDARRVIDVINFGTDAPSPVEKRLHEQLEREIEEMNRVFSKPEGDA
jgi:hypothetical protein